MKGTEYIEGAFETVLFVKKCGDGKTCNLSSGQCVKKLKLKKIGEKCSVTTDCEKGYCSGGKCAGKSEGSDCNDYENSCDEELVCQKGKCVKPLNSTEGESCYSTEDCQFNLICDVVGTTSTKKCVRKYSLDSGTKAKNSLSCKSGISVLGTCVDVIGEVATCLDDCKMSTKYGNETGVYPGGDKKCDKTASGERRCKPASDSEEWSKFLTIYNDAIDNLKTEKQIKKWKKAGNYGGNKTLIDAKMGYDYYFETKGIKDECVLDFYRQLVNSQTKETISLLMLSL